MRRVSVKAIILGAGVDIGGSIAAFAILLPALKSACEASSEPAAPVSFWAGVNFTPDYKVLARAAILFAGRNPTAEEEAAVTIGGTPLLRQTIRGYMQGAAFDAFLNEAGETHFLTRGMENGGTEFSL